MWKNGSPRLPKPTKKQHTTNMNKTIILSTLIATAGFANAATLVSSTFDGNTGATVLAGNADNTSGSSTLNVAWTGDEAGSASALTAIAPAGGFTIVNNGSNAYSNNNVAYINHNLNIADRANERGYSFTFTTTVAYDLTGLTLLSGHTNDSAASDQAFTSDLSVSISGGIFTDTTNVDYNSGATIKTQNYDLTGTSLSAGTEYTITVTSANMLGGGAYAVYDGITLEGNVSAVPEPSASALLGLGGLALILRRRK